MVPGTVREPVPERRIGTRLVCRKAHGDDTQGMQINAYCLSNRRLMLLCSVTGCSGRRTGHGRRIRHSQAQCKAGKYVKAGQRKTNIKAETFRLKHVAHPGKQV